MSCPVLLDPSCVAGNVIGSAVGSAAGTAANDALSGIASAIQSGVAWITANSVSWWVQVPSPDLAGRARGRPAPAVDAPDRCRRRRLRHARRRREDGADPPRESARRCRIGAGDHRRDLRGRGPAAHAAAEGRGCLVGLGTERLGRRAVRRPADRPAGHDRGHGPGRGPHPGHRRDRDQRVPGDADAVPPGCPGRPRRDAPAGRRGHAHPGNPPVVPQDHRVDARADLL